jgi:hypothetical protein
MLNESQKGTRKIRYILDGVIIAYEILYYFKSAKESHIYFSQISFKKTFDTTLRQRESDDDKSMR